jgi:general nucleoside transport system permease protein
VKGIADISSLLGDAVAAMAPLLFAALGGLLTELTGMLNIALEGLILVGAFFGIAIAGTTHSLLAGLAGGMLASGLLAAVFGLVTLRGKANEFITGLAANLLAAGLTVVLSAQLFGTKGVVAFSIPALPRLDVPALRSIPVLGELLFRHNVLVYASWIVTLLAWVLIAKTPFGMRLKATGSNPKAIVALGLKPERYRFAAIVLSGFGCGLAGCCLSLGLSAYVPNISSGRGWIALVAIYLGGRKPLGVLAACFVFAAADSFSNYAQGFLKVPSDFILAIPYVVTLAALVAGALWKRLRSAAD